MKVKDSTAVEEALRAANDSLRYALRAARMGTWEWDLVGDVVVWSPETEDIFGIERGSFGGDYAAYAALVAPESLDRINELVEEFLRVGDVDAEIHYQHSIVRPGGEVAWVEVRGTLTKDDQGNPVHMTGVCADISKRVLQEKEHADLTDKLHQAQKMEAIGQLAGGVAHDFNNILTAILGNIEFALLDHEATLPPDVVTALKDIDTNANRAADLTRQLLAFSRRQVAKLQVLDVDQALDAVEPMLRRLLTENIVVERNRGELPVIVRSDPAQIEQIVMNLTINGRDAMPDGGLLSLEASAVTLEAHDVIDTSTCAPGPYVMLAVSDSGQGMSEETMARIYEPFFTTKELGQGTGLGLATVFGIVKQNRGHITVQSELGEGTTFRVYLPALDGPAPSEEEDERATEGVTTGDETIILAEDDEHVRKLSCRLLAAAGYQVIPVNGGRAALEALELHRTRALHLLITDVIMHDTNGKQLADAMRRVRPDLRVLYISGYTADIIGQHGVLDRDVEFLEKPFTPQALLRRVRNVLA